MRRVAEKQERCRKNTPLVFLLLFSFVAFGAYYHFVLFLIGAVLCGLLIDMVCRKKRLFLSTVPEAWALYAMLGVSLVAVPFAVSPGAALSGCLRLLVYCLFACYVASYTAAERQDILQTGAYAAALMALVSVMKYCGDMVCNIPDSNGRIDGFFEYANTYSLFLLLALLILFYKKPRRWQDYGAMAVLICGIFLSGSRGVFVLLAIVGLLEGVRFILRSGRIVPVLLCIGSGVVIGTVASVLSGGMVWQRILAMTAGSSSLNGRLLYMLDGLKMIGDHPMGIGREGYLYLQPFYQTGVYTLKHIHNEYLQMALDGGILAGLLLLALVVMLLLRKGAAPLERILVFVIGCHALIDFDLQFGAVFFLLLLCGDFSRKGYTMVGKRRFGIALCSILMVCLSYFTLTYFLQFTGHPAAAYALYPADIVLAEERLQSCSSVQEAEPFADKIITYTDCSMLAYDCKFAAAVQRGDWIEMVKNKYAYLRLNSYREEVYRDFAVLLKNGMKNVSTEEKKIFQNYARLAQGQLSAVMERTSRLAYRIYDKPNFSSSAELQAEFQQMKEE